VPLVIWTPASLWLNPFAKSHPSGSSAIFSQNRVIALLLTSGPDSSIMDFSQTWTWDQHSSIIPSLELGVGPGAPSFWAWRGGGGDPHPSWNPAQESSYRPGNSRGSRSLCSPWEFALFTSCYLTLSIYTKYQVKHKTGKRLYFQTSHRGEKPKETWEVREWQACPSFVKARQRHPVGRCLAGLRHSEGAGEAEDEASDLKGQGHPRVKWRQVTTCWEMEWNWRALKKGLETVGHW
jgi:hypothetical protein